MLHRLILKVTKFQLPPKRFSTVVKNILRGHHAPPPCQNLANVMLDMNYNRASNSDLGLSVRAHSFKNVFELFLVKIFVKISLRKLNIKQTEIVK